MWQVDLPVQQPAEVEDGRVRTPLNLTRKTRVAIGSSEVVGAQRSAIGEYRRECGLGSWTRQFVGRSPLGSQNKDYRRQEDDGADVSRRRSSDSHDYGNKDYQISRESTRDRDGDALSDSSR